ncbi:MAG: hypothetical protein IPN38_05965 [Flavobacteriales bacterium]|nr:hypothetical protein [Flavobacteriales bacterium]
MENDIIYVQPNPELARELLQDLAPLITLLTTTVLVLGMVQGFSQLTLADAGRGGAPGTNWTAIVSVSRTSATSSTLGCSSTSSSAR